MFSLSVSLFSFGPSSSLDCGYGQTDQLGQRDITAREVREDGELLVRNMSAFLNRLLGYNKNNVKMNVLGSSSASAGDESSAIS